MSESRTSSGVRWHRSAALLLATSLAAGCVDDSVAPGPQATPDPGQPSVLGFVEVIFDRIGTPDQSSSVLSAPSIAALEELRAERERLRESDEDIALVPTPIQEGEGTIQFGTRTSNGVASPPNLGRWYGHGTFLIRNAQADGTAYTTPRQNLTLQAISTDNSLSGTAIRQLTLNNGDPADPLVALDVLPSGRVETVDDTLSAVKPDVLQLVAEADIQDLNSNLPPGVNTIFPYGFVVRHSADTNSRTLPVPTGPDDFQGEVDIAYSMPLEDGENIGSMSITFIALDYGLDATWVTQSREEQTPDAAAAVLQRAQDLNADITTMLPTLPAWRPDSPPGPRCLDSVRTAGLPDSPTAYLSKTDWTNQPTMNPQGGTVPVDQVFQATFDTELHGFGPRQMVVQQLDADMFFFLNDATLYTGNGTNTITTPPGNFTPGAFDLVVIPFNCDGGVEFSYSVEP